MKKEEMDIQLSVIETERKYSALDYSETTYSNNAIVSYGKENDMPILLRNCYRGSATLKSVIDQYIPYILGENIIVSDLIAKFKTQVNESGMTMRQFIASLALDYMVYGGFCFQVVLSKMGTIHSLIPLDFSRARTNETGTKIFYSNKGWTKWGTKSQEYPRFNPEERQPSSIFYFKGDFTKNVYPLPTWYGALYDVLTEIECSKYSLNSVSCGFSARYVINLPNAGNLTKEQKDIINQDIKKKFAGVESESNFMLYFSNSDKSVTVNKVESDDATDRYIAIKDNCRSNIYTALRCSPLLMGLPAQNGFSTSEYRDCFKIFNKCVIQPIQDMIIECLDKTFVKTLNGEHAVIIEPFEIKFESENEQ